MPSGVPASEALEASSSPLFLHQQITEALRSSILSGEISEGTRLPSMEELARKWNTSYFTIRQAMKPLAQEGLVEHRRRIGTVVKGARPRLTRMGVYYGTDVLGMAETTFYRSLHAELRARLAQRDIELIPFIDERAESDQHTPLPTLAKAIEERSIQAVVIPISNRVVTGWLREIPLPKALIGASEVPWAVRPDHRQQLRLAFSRLLEQGARSVGVIVNLPRDFDPAIRSTLPFLSAFEEEAVAAGLEVKPQWIVLPPRVLSPPEMEPFGYRAFLNFWEQSTPPDALLSTSDVIGRGALMAVLKLGIEVPEKLRIVQWVNAGTGFFTPLPVDRIILQEAQVADALIDRIDCQLSGHAVRPVAIRCHLVTAEEFSKTHSL